mgnify:CR=1 FL=1
MKKLFLGFILLSCLSIQVKAEQYVKAIYVKFNLTGEGVRDDINGEIKRQANNGAKAISIAVDGNWAYILFEK